MKSGPVVHGLLLVLALTFAYQTWTREEKVEPKTGKVEIWKQSEASFQSVVFDSDDKTVRIERLQDEGASYLWGKVTRTKTVRKKKEPEPEPEPVEEEPEEGEDGEDGDKPAGKDGKKDGDEAAGKDGEKDADEAAGKDGEETAEKDGEDSAEDGDEEAEEEPEAEEKEPEFVEELVTTTREFPVGEAGEELVKNLADLRALRDLGVLDDEKKKQYGLAEATDNLTIVFKGNDPFTLLIGERIYGGSDVYALNPMSGKGYVISNEIMRHVNGAETALGLKKFHDFEDDEVAKVKVKTKTQERTLIKKEVEDEKGERTTWSDSATPDSPDQTLANFLDRVKKLRPTEYPSDLDRESLQQVGTISYVSDTGEKLGFLELYREEASEEDEAVPEAPGRPARQPGPTYYIRTERTRVLGRVSRITAERLHQDLADNFGAEAPAKEEVEDQEEEPTDGESPEGATPGKEGEAVPGGANPHGGGAHGPHGGARRPGKPRGGGRTTPAGRPGSTEKKPAKPGPKKASPDGKPAD